MARTKSKKRLVGTWSTQQRREAMEQSREAARGPVDLPFLLLTLLLTAMGMVMVLSASFPSAYYENNGNGAYYFVRQGIFAVLGLAAMFGLSKMNYQRLRGVGRLLLWGSILLLVLVIVPGNPIAITENNATRWLGIRGTFLRFQPSELAKMAVVIYFSATISKKREKMQTWSQGIWPYVLILGVIALLMMREPHLSGTILIVCTGIVLMIVGGIKGWLIPLGIGGVGLVGALYVVLVQKGILHYGENRINTWRDPFNAEWYRGDGWQIAQCLIAIGSGGIFGNGLFGDRYYSVPNAHNDFILSWIGNSAGFVGCCVVLGVLFALVVKTFATGARSEDLLGSYICAGIGGALMAQIAVNVGMNLRLLPVIGVTLPFYSAGGSSVLMLYICVGLVLSVYSHNTKSLFG